MRSAKVTTETAGLAESDAAILPKSLENSSSSCVSSSFKLKEFLKPIDYWSVAAYGVSLFSVLHPEDPLNPIEYCQSIAFLHSMVSGELEFLNEKPAAATSSQLHSLLPPTPLLRLLRAF